METCRCINVFIASPGDLNQERRAFRKVINALNDRLGQGSNVVFNGYGWEDIPQNVSCRTQSAINCLASTCDVHVFTLYKRWGQDAPDASPYSSYTEEELGRAIRRRQDTNSPLILFYLKNIPEDDLRNPDLQLQKVLAFREQLESELDIDTFHFSDPSDFQNLLDGHLSSFLSSERPRLKNSLAFSTEPEPQNQNAMNESRAREIARSAAERARRSEMIADSHELSLAARSTRNLLTLSLLYEYYRLSAQLDSARWTMEKSLRLLGPHTDSVDAASVLCNLGIAERMLGFIDRAEEHMRRSLAIVERLKDRQRMATCYLNLGVIAFERNNYNLAINFYEQALRIYVDLNNEVSIARIYGNQATVLRAQGYLNEALKLRVKSLEIFRKHNLLEHAAGTHANIGNIYLYMGDAAAAISEYQRAEDLHRSFGHEAKTADILYKLGEAYKKLGQLESTIKSWTEARDLFHRTGYSWEKEKLSRKLNGIVTPG